jgi:diguanylate cyclase (GGDEF)-like protein
MELQAVTASAATGLTLITIALFMLGMYLTARRDLCTGYWAIASVLMAIGSLSPFPLYGTPYGLAGIWFSSVTVIAGGVWWWWGMRLFFGRSVSPAGWWIIGLNALVIAGLFYVTWDKEPRLIAFAGFVALAVILVVREAWVGDGTPVSLSRAMIILSFTGTMLSIGGRAAYFATNDLPVTPLSNDTVNVILLYLGPMMCVILAAVGTLLMYFQRTIAQKEHLASHDDLTSLFNRRALAGAGRSALSACPGDDNAVAVLLIDVDHFKTVNDTLGHEAGDTVLRTVAEALAANCRRTDVLGRLGGEEFCVVCPGTDLAAARGLGDRLLDAIAAIPQPGGLARAVSISIGIATGGRATSWDAILSRADRALYAAKEAGRGQAMIA